ncbi:MAG: site-specific integrase [Aestuariivirga sp.]|nr:site-specific integrase [Aestuariivirga sp.]
MAKKAAAAAVIWAEELVQSGLAFLKNGPKASLSHSDIELMAERYGAQLIGSDLDMRKKGFGLNLPKFSIPLTIGPLPPLPKREPGLTDDDLGLLKYLVEKVEPEVKGALARQRPPQYIKDAAQEALAGAGIALPEASPERRELELAFLQQRMKALQATSARNTGEIVATPAIAEQAGQTPTIQVAFEHWKSGVGTGGEKLPTQGSVEEAAYAVRRFKELHGNLQITEITSAKARAFRDAIAKVPPQLPKALQRLPLPKLLETLGLSEVKPASATVNKRLTLMAAILKKAAIRFELKGRPGGWHDPFEGLKITISKGAAQQRATFTILDLKVILNEPFISIGDHSAKGGRGLAARWMPLLNMFTGARRGELAQLKLHDIREEDGVPFLRITDEGGDQSVKNAGSIRRVPVHPELLKLGFMEFVKSRREESNSESWLLEGLVTNRKGDRGDAWGRWFGRQLRRLKIDHNGRKVFHSFRHTFIARCREAEIEEEIRFALTGHSDGGSVGRSYGGDEGGYKHSLKRLHRETSKVSYPGLDLSHLYVP